MVAYYLRQGSGFLWVVLRLADIFFRGGAPAYCLLQEIDIHWIVLKLVS